jgi:hypothetical protein
VLLFQKNYGQRTIYGSTLPKAIGVMLVAMFKLKGANDKFIHTSYSMKETPTKKMILTKFYDHGIY